MNQLTPQQQERRQRFLKAAQELFCEQGFERTNLDQVVALTGGSKQTLYRYFKDKLGLFHAVVESLSEEVLVSDELVEIEGYEQALQRFSRNYLTQVMSPVVCNIYRVVLCEARQLPELAREFLEQGPLQSLLQLSDYLARLNKAGKLAIDEPDLAADQLLSSLRGHAHLQNLFCGIQLDEVAINHQADSAVQAFLKSYAA